MKIAIIANGELGNPELIKKLISHYDSVIAADGGANYCRLLGITPSLIIGDQDSISLETAQAFSHVPTKVCPRDKDHSDLELALQEAKDADSIALFAAFGNRADHSLNNLYILSRYPGKITLESEKESISMLSSYCKVSVHPGQILSLIPLGPATGVTTKGLKWELSNATMDSHFLSLSNVCLDTQVEIDVQSGTLLLCLQRD